MKRRDLIPKIQELGINSFNLHESLVAFVCQFDGLSSENVDIEKLKAHLKNIVCRLKIKYKQHSRTYSKFVKMEEPWLSEAIEISETVKFVPNAGPGRPKKDWDDCGGRAKRGRVNELSQNELEPLLLAAAKCAKSDKKEDLSFVIKKSIKNNDMKSIKKAVVSPVTRMSTEEALALKVHTDLSDGQYQMIRNSSKAHNADIYPTLHEILDEKKNCYPEDLEISETEAKCTLKSLVDHTLSRIIQVCEPQILQSVNENEVKGTLYMKGGFDGASSQSLYKQRYESEDVMMAKSDEESLFLTAIVPLKLVLGDVDVWSNKRPNSSHHCRPLHLQYRKETKELAIDEQQDVLEQLDRLGDIVVLPKTEASDVSLKITVDVKLDLTMFDNKIVNFLTDTKSTASCNVCGAKPTDMNNIEEIYSRPVNEDACAYGLSTLHCWIRSFEYILHLGYKREIRKHKATTKEEKLSVARNKSIIQEEFKRKMSLIADVPRVGHGNTNDGNTARRAFSNPEGFSQITGVDMEVINR